MMWHEIKTPDDLPKKPDKLDYEQIDCLIVHKGDILHRMWNCEHNVWDGDDGDDFFCDAMEPSHWMEIRWPSDPDPTTPLLARMAEALTGLLAFDSRAYVKQSDLARDLLAAKLPSRKVLAEYAAMTGENAGG